MSPYKTQTACGVSVTLTANRQPPDAAREFSATFSGAWRWDQRKERKTTILR
jgi:hypothetical protein